MTFNKRMPFNLSRSLCQQRYSFNGNVSISRQMFHTLMVVVLCLAHGVLNSSHPDWSAVKVWNEKRQRCFRQSRDLKPDFLHAKPVTQPSGFGSHRSCPWASQPWKQLWEETSSPVLITATGSKTTLDFMISGSTTLSRYELFQYKLVQLRAWITYVISPSNPDRDEEY